MIHTSALLTWHIPPPGLLAALTAALESVSLAVEDALELLTAREEKKEEEEEEEEEEVVVEVEVEVAVEEESRFRIFFFSGTDTYFSQRRQFRQLLVSAGSESLCAIFARS